MKRPRDRWYGPGLWPTNKESTVPSLPTDSPLNARDEMTQRSKRGFLQRVANSLDDEACWPWMGVVNEHGYGRFTYRRSDGRSLAGRAHRIAYELSGRDIPPGLQLDHLCRNRRCCNPAHLEPVTAVENNHRQPDFKGASIETRPNDFRVVWRVGGKKQYRTFDTEVEAVAFVEGRFSALREAS